VVLAVAPPRVAALDVGGARVDVGGRLATVGVVDTGGGPRQWPRLEYEPVVDAAIRRWLRLHVVARAAVGGPYEDADAGFLDVRRTFQDRSPSLEVCEAVAEVRSDVVDVAAGLQTVAWGRLDGFPPNDVVVPRDLHDPFVRDPEDAKIGVPALTVTAPLRFLSRVTGVGTRIAVTWVPLAVPSRLALPDERWFPSNAAPADQVTLPKRLVEQSLRAVFGPAVSVAGPVVVPVALQVRNHPASFDLGTQGIAARLAGRTAGLDWDLYHYTGPETGPDLTLRSVLRLRRFAIDRATGVATLSLRATATLEQATNGIHATGIDVATTWGDVALRGEAAWTQGRPYLRAAGSLLDAGALAALPTAKLTQQLVKQGRAVVPLAPLFVQRDAIEWGVGADRTVAGIFVLLQLAQIVFLEPVPDLVVGDPDTRLTVMLRRDLARDDLSLEVRGVGMLEKAGWFAFPRLVYRPRDGLSVSLGYLALGGPRSSQRRGGDRGALGVLIGAHDAGDAPAAVVGHGPTCARCGARAGSRTRATWRRCTSSASLGAERSG